MHPPQLFCALVYPPLPALCGSVTKKGIVHSSTMTLLYVELPGGKKWIEGQTRLCVSGRVSRESVEY